ncbi:MAG: M67 family peptidase [Nitrosopumilus sp. B06]|nr:MAG: M67 family peptidase [Nitrosopumilus sp. D6]RNJ79053.1 MAG: M67 family peptidase [Nitrosopumilus sp. B06]
MQSLEDYAEQKKPDESCAVLLGTDWRVSEVIFAENAAESKTSFAIPDEQLISIYETAEKKGTDVIGIFHSHPASEAYPSETDTRFMHINPVVWVIYSGRDHMSRAFVLKPGISEVPIHVE